MTQLAGTVTNISTKAPVAGLQLTLRYSTTAGPATNTTQTDAKGDYRFDVTALTSATAVSVVVPPRWASPPRVPFATMPLAVAAPVDLEVWPLFAISGLITDLASGAAVPNIAVQLSGPFAPGLFSAVAPAASDGRYTFPDVAGGARYALDVATPGYEVHGVAPVVIQNLSQDLVVDFRVTKDPALSLGEKIGIGLSVGVPVAGALASAIYAVLKAKGCLPKCITKLTTQTEANALPLQDVVAALDGVPSTDAAISGVLSRNPGATLGDLSDVDASIVDQVASAHSSSSTAVGDIANTLYDQVDSGTLDDILATLADAGPQVIRPLMAVTRASPRLATRIAVEMGENALRNSTEITIPADTTQLGVSFGSSVGSSACARRARAMPMSTRPASHS